MRHKSLEVVQRHTCKLFLGIGPGWWSSGRRTRLLPNDSSSNPTEDDNFSL